ncbi:hypothetical protein [Microbulbifer thermotolerans]|uniref:Lipoprotein n=1 Tax=Microbulbifer thermotolerans TaxID=252514 RepID=A0AB35HTX5_MICTH|nr:hypothetical protein [Microbulbifer thermotolerans]MCX2780873.1 hypothetical protein [Microbulbifer thermotolerans]MCX2784273.1 hypothetical protein [Microbulbifer thermotolerans]MCX2794350.1 hypothetical protein [Microbulbifer thermotolerans]MCX2800998.1 hypothetical protein [Microbulbifer thermotolerans]MCX2804838.1 hypothetical protein [Microbulbifer thermotolerans]
MLRYLALARTLLAVTPLVACGVADPRDEVVYPYSRPIPRAAEYRVPEVPRPVVQPAASETYRDACPGDAEELAEGSICPPSAQCFDIAGGRRCIVHEK